MLAEAAARGGRGGDAAADHVHQQIEFTPELVVRTSSGRSPLRPAGRPA